MYLVWQQTQMDVYSFDLDDDAAAVDIGRDGDSKEEDPGLKQLARRGQMEDGGEFLEHREATSVHPPTRY